MSVNYKSGLLEVKPTNQYQDQLIKTTLKLANVYNPPLFEKNGCRLYMNENLLGPAPACVEALKEVTLDDLALYAYGGDLAIKERIAQFNGVEPEEVLINQGSASVIQQVLAAFLDEGDSIYLPRPGWDYYRSVAATLGAKINYFSLEEKSDTFDFNISKMIQEIQQANPKLVVITSPNMPTGHVITPEQLYELAQTLEDTMILLDEAYYGFNHEYSFREREILNHYPNIMILRTFSKFYGLASVRLGYALCNRNLNEYFHKVSPLFGVSILSQKVVTAALDSEEYYSQLRRQMVQIREEFSRQVDQIQGFKVYQSQANFVLINTGDWSAEDIVSYCRKNGYLIRDCKGYGLYKHIRVTIGSELEMNEIVRLLQEFVSL